MTRPATVYTRCRRSSPGGARESAKPPSNTTGDSTRAAASNPPCARFSPSSSAGGRSYSRRSSCWAESPRCVVYNTWIKAPGDVTDENAEFQDTERPAGAPPPSRTRRRSARRETFVWPDFGYTPNRARYLRAESSRRSSRSGSTAATASSWSSRPSWPRACSTSSRNDGVAVALNAQERQRQVAAAHRQAERVVTGLRPRPPVHRHAVRPHHRARRARRAGSCWRKKLASRSESSPIVVNNRVFFGSENGTVYGDGREHRQDRPGPTRRAARSRARWRSRTASSTSATTAGR